MARGAVCGLLVAGLILTFAAPASAPAAARTVRVGVYENEPKVFTGPDGEPAGIFIDLIESVAEEEGWKLEYVDGSWEEGLAGLREGRIDLMPDVAYSAERDATYDFHTRPVVESWSYVYAAPGIDVSTASDLDGKRIAVLRGSIQQTVFAQMTQGFGYEVDLIPVDSLKEGFDLASGGMVDGAIANNFFGDYFFQQYRLEKTPVAFSAVPLHYATAAGQDSDLLEAIDARLEEWRRTPGSPYYQALGRYTSREPLPGTPPWVAWAAGAALALLLAAGAVIFLLRWQVSLRTRSLLEANRGLAEAHEAVVEAEERLRLALDASNEGIWDWDPTTDRIQWSPRLYTMLGYEPDEFPVDLPKWESLVHRDDRDAAISKLRRRIETGDRSFWLEYRMRAKNGDWIWVAGRGQAVDVDASGTIRRVVGTTTDITRRRQAEEALAESENRYRSIVETSPDAIFFLDCEGRIQMSNTRAVDQCGGGDARKLVGRPFSDYLAPEDRDRFEKTSISDPLHAHPAQMHVTMVCPEGRELRVLVSAATITDARGRPAAIVVTARGPEEGREAPARPA